MSATVDRRLHAFVDAHWRKLLAAILLLALGARVAMLLSLRGSVYGSFLLWDERTYDRWAQSIIEGRPFYVFTVSPLPAYWTAALYALGGPSPLFVRCVHVALGVGTCGWLFAIGRRLGGLPAGLVSALGAALYQPFVLLDVTLLKEPLALFLFAWTIATGLAEAEEHRLWRPLLLGIVGGLLVSVRPNAVVVLPVLAAWIAWRLLRRTASWRTPAVACLLLGVGFAAATAPFAVANGRGTGRYSPLALGGFSLYRGNVLDGTSPYYNPVAFASTSPDTEGVEFSVEASRRAGRTLTLAEASGYWAGEVWRTAREHPGDFGRKLLTKALASANAWEEGDNHSIPFLREHLPFLRLPPFAFWLIMPLGLAGLLSLAVEGDGRARALLAVVLAYGATMVLVFSNMRIRAPLVIVLIPLAAAGLQRAIEHVRARSRRIVGWAAVVAAAAVLERLPVPGTGDLAGHMNTHAAALMAAGRIGEAVEWWKRSSETHGLYSSFADIALATTAFDRGDRPTAWAWLDRVPASSHAAVLKYTTAGHFLMVQGDAKAAAVAFEAALSRNGAQLAALRGAIDANRLVNPARAQELQDQLRHLGQLYDLLAPGVSGPLSRPEAGE